MVFLPNLPITPPLFIFVFVIGNVSCWSRLSQYFERILTDKMILLAYEVLTIFCVNDIHTFKEMGDKDIKNIDIYVLITHYLLSSPSIIFHALCLV